MSTTSLNAEALTALIELAKGAGTVTIRRKRWTATEGQTLFELDEGSSYVRNVNRLWVWVGGVPQFATDNFTETDTTSFTLSEGVDAGTIVDAMWFEASVLLVNAHASTHEDGGADPIDLDNFEKFTDLYRDVNQRVVNVKTYGALGDDSTDDTSAIADAVTAVSDGGIVFFPAGTYISGAISPAKNITFLGLSPESTILKAKASINVDFIGIDADKTLRFENITIDGNGANQTQEPNFPQAISVEQGSLKMYKCKVQNARNFAVYVYGGHDVEIVDCEINQGADTFMDCIQIRRSHNIKIHGNMLIGGWSGIRCLSYNSKIIISNNIQESAYMDVGYTVAQSTDVVIIGNIARNNTRSGFEIDLVYRAVLEGNISRNNQFHGFLVAEYAVPAGDDGTMDSDTITGGNTYRGKDILLSTNESINNGEHGIAVNGMDYVDIKGNLISNNNTTNAGFAGLGITDSIVTYEGNTFKNIGNQTQSVGYSSRTYKETSGQNHHYGGDRYTQPVVGGMDANTDPYLLTTTGISGSTNTLVADTKAPGGLARQVNDSDGSGDTSISKSITILSKDVDQLAFVMVRSPDTLASIEFIINLYNGASFVTTVIDTTYSSLLSDEYVILAGVISAAVHSASTYDTVIIQLKTTIPETGKLNIGQISLYYPAED